MKRTIIMERSTQTIISRLLFAGFAAVLLCAATPAEAQGIRWAGNVDVARLGVLNAPDNRYVPLAPPVTVNNFGPVMNYRHLARLLGVSRRDLERADVIAFEGNGGHGAGIEQGFESSVWTFSDDVNTYVARFNETVGRSSEPAVIATGSIRGDDGTILTGNAEYSAFFGMCSPEPTSPVISFILFDLDAISPAINTDSPVFLIRMENGHRADGSFGEGTPDPDAVGIFSDCATGGRAANDAGVGMDGTPALDHLTAAIHAGASSLPSSPISDSRHAFFIREPGSAYRKSCDRLALSRPAPEKLQRL